TFVGAGEVGSGVGTLASPSSWSHERLAPPPRGDASVPTPLNPSPAPTGTNGLPRRHHEIPTLESGGGWEEGRGRLRRPRPALPVHYTSHDGRRKRPHSPHPPPPPLRDDSASLLVS